MSFFNSEYYKRVCFWMDELAKINNTIFLGQMVLYSGRMYGTLNNVPEKKCLEIPVAEELQIGMSLGLSLNGYFPISLIQRMDFLPRAADQIINHLSKIESMSHGEYIPKVLIRTTIGSKKPLDVGIQHSQDLTEMFRQVVNFPIYKPMTVKELDRAYRQAIDSDRSSMIIETQEYLNE